MQRVVKHPRVAGVAVELGPVAHRPALACLGVARKVPGSSGWWLCRRGECACKGCAQRSQHSMPCAHARLQAGSPQSLTPRGLGREGAGVRDGGRGCLGRVAARHAAVLDACSSSSMRRRQRQRQSWCCMHVSASMRCCAGAAAQGCRPLTNDAPLLVGQLLPRPHGHVKVVLRAHGSSMAGPRAHQHTRMAVRTHAAAAGGTAGGQHQRWWRTMSLQHLASSTGRGAGQEASSATTPASIRAAAGAPSSPRSPSLVGVLVGRVGACAATRSSSRSASAHARPQFSAHGARMHGHCRRGAHRGRCRSRARRPTCSCRSTRTCGPASGRSCPGSRCRRRQPRSRRCVTGAHARRVAGGCDARRAGLLAAAAALRAACSRLTAHPHESA